MNLVRYLPPSYDPLTGLRFANLYLGRRRWGRLGRTALSLIDEGRSFHPEAGVPWLAVLTTDVVLLSMDLVGFAYVNDEYGHEVGDRILAETGRRLQAVAGPWPAYRFGGDDFLVYARMADDKLVWPLAAALREALEAPITITQANGVDSTVELRVRLGIARPRMAGADALGLLDAADPYRGANGIPVPADLVAPHCSHTHRQVGGSLDTPPGGEQSVCVACMFDATRGVDLGGPATMSALCVEGGVRLPNGSGRARFGAQAPSMCECRCGHAEREWMRSLEITDDRTIVCRMCVDAGHATTLALDEWRAR